MKSKIILVFLICLALLIFTACGVEDKTDNSNTQENEQKDSESDDTESAQLESESEEVENYVENYLDKFSISPACNGNYNALNIFFDFKQLPQNIVLEYREVTSDFKVLKEIPSQIEGYELIDICDECKDISISEGKDYDFRLTYQIDNVEYSSKLISILTTEDSKFLEKQCSSTSLPACGDSDGGNSPNKAGIVTYKKTDRYKDECVDEKTVKEYFCDDNREVKSEEHTCQKECKMGRCLLV